jgi:methyl-accepting chemotaxis protein
MRFDFKEMAMRSWTIGKRLTIGFAMVLAVCVALGGYTVIRLSEIERLALGIRDEAVPGLAAFTDIRGIALSNASTVLRMAMSDNPDELAQLEKDIKAGSEESDRLYKEYEGTIVQDEDRRLFQAVQEARSVNSAARKQFISYTKAHTPDESAAEYSRSMVGPQTEYLKAIDAATNFNRKISTDYSTEITAAVDQTRTWTFVGLLLAVAIGGGVAFAIIRSTNRVLGDAVSTLTEGSHQLVSAAGQVSTSSQALSQGATEQAASLEETSASMEEMASMTRQNAENSQTAASLMKDVDAKVQGSNQALGDMVASMASIQESSRQVAKIIKTIDEIAFQTNILALNAAVEAARAGEAGMGFAVVADEVRNLAQRSAQAARDTATLIEESIGRATSGNAKVEQVAAAIAAITESVGQVKQLVDGVSVASRQQSQGIDQVSQAVSQMEKVTQTTAATAEESAAASEELNAQAEGVMQVVGKLERLVTAVAAGHGQPVQAPMGGVVRSAARVLRMSAPAAPKAPSAEEQLPMEGTGTFGKF